MRAETSETSDSSKIKRIQDPIETFRRMPDLIGTAVEDAAEEIAEDFSNVTLQTTNETDLGKECAKGEKLVVVSQMPEKAFKVSNSPISNLEITTKCQVPHGSDENDEEGDIKPHHKPNTGCFRDKQMPLELNSKDIRGSSSLKTKRNRSQF